MRSTIFIIGLAAIMFLVLPVSAADNKSEPDKKTITVVNQGEGNTAEAVSSTQPADETIRAGEEINWQVISGGGSMNGTSENYTLSGTVGQTAVGSGNSDNYGLQHGFWVSSGCCNLGGDANNDASVNVGDAVYMINYVFKSGDPPDCGDEGDANFDCSLNVGDAVYLINYVFKSGNPPLCGCVGW